MSREIKFRAWLSGEYPDITFRENKMEYNVTVGQHGYYVSGWGYIPEVELMQYTGLKDKNGVEIYEGDIVEQYPDDIGYYIRTVEYKYHGFALSKLASFLQHDVDWSKQVKVIGNIHENTELLKAGN